MASQYNNIGWTAQKPPINYADISTAPWKIPGDIDSVSIVGGFQSMDGGRTTGWVEFKATQPLIHVATKNQLLNSDFYCVIGMDGLFTANLPATDTTALRSSEPWLYSVRVVLNHRTTDTGFIALPKDPMVVDFSDLVMSADEVSPTATSASGWIVLGANDPIPTGLAAGTLIIRKNA